MLVKQPKRVAIRTVILKSGAGTISIRTNSNPFRMTKEERDLFEWITRHLDAAREAGITEESDNAE